MTNCRHLLAQNMRKYRNLLGISQMILADKVGCSTTLIGNIETSKRFPSADNIDRIAKALGVKVADLFSETETESVKAMATRRKLKTEFEKIMGKTADELLNKVYPEGNPGSGEPRRKVP